MQEIITHLEQRLRRPAIGQVFLFKDGHAQATLAPAALVPLAAPHAPAKPLLFVDGGEGILLEAAGFIVARLRVAGVLFTGIVRTGMRIADYRIVVEREGREAAAQVSLALRGDPLPQEIVDAFLREAPALVRQAGLAALPGFLRSMLESHHATAWARELGAQLLVKDGPLAHAARAGPSGSYAAEQESALAKQGIPLLGVLKTCSMRCEDGTSVVAAMRAIADSPAAFSLGDADGVMRMVALLHKDAAAAFVVQASSPGQEGMAQVSSLIPLCADIAWLGYPYPLVLADQLARVSNEEVAEDKVRILVSLARGQGRALGAELASKESHDVLDRMRY